MIRKLNQQENKNRNKENQHGYNKIFLEKCLFNEIFIGF